MTHAERAGELFDLGYNCSQSLAGAFASDLNMSVEDVCRMTMGFGGGVSRLREVCGAILGMTFVSSCLMGYGLPDAERKAEMYAFIQDLAAQFKERTGSLICRELLGLDENAPTPPTPDARTPEYYATRPCRKIIMTGAEILEKALKEKNII